MTGKEDRPVCKHCRKAVDQDALEAHMPACFERRRQAAKRKKERSDIRKKEALAKAKEAAGPDDTSQSTKRPPKKRKADEEAPASKTMPDKDGPKKKKARKEDPSKARPAKPRGPVNVEIQCGVQIEPEKGGFCARSLTCKTHSMGLKRAVPGRSLPYDQLLALYTKKNQARQQKALLEAQVSAQVEEEANAGEVDPEEEREAVMVGLARWRPTPSEQVVTVQMPRRYQYIRFKEMLGNAMRISGGHAAKNIFSVPDGSV